MNALAPRPFVNANVSIDDDTLSAVLEHIKNDVALVDSMRTCAQLARCAARVLRERHGLESDQLAAYVAALLGKNVFITGGGGCGKTFVSRMIVDAARKCMGYAAVAVCAPTGLAAAAVGGITLDKLMGSRKVRAEWPTGVMRLEEYRLRSLSNVNHEEEENLFLDRGEVFAPVRSPYVAEQLLATRIILIDEVSMVSAAKLELLLAVLADYRGGALAAAASARVQFVCVGDFAQLKPVCPNWSPEAKAPRGGEFAFRSPAWKKLQFIPAPLSVNHRCAHFEWNVCLARLRKGDASASLCERIRALTAAPATTAEAAATGSVGIFAKNTMVAEFNRRLFETLPGAAMTFLAEDAPTSWGALPKRMPAALNLKVGCSVMVVKNLRNGPHNGASGVVVANNYAINSLDGGVLVKFDDCIIGEQRVGAVVDRQTYKHFRSGSEENGERRQLPLQLAAAFSVHKAQGRSISRPLHVDASTFWKESGMFYVSVSRTTDPANLSIAGLDRAIKYIAPEVLSFHCSLEMQPLPRWA